MDYKVDYHIHSDYSDGTMSPVNLVKKFNEEKYDLISITDHDSIAGFREASIAGEALEIKVVPGVELSTECAFTLTADADAAHPAGTPVKIDIHLLGYYFDVENEALKETLAKMAENRRRRNEKMAEALEEMGYPVDLQALSQKSRGGYVGKPNIARAWVEQGLIANVSDAWEAGRLFASPQIKAIHKEKLQTEDAIALLKQAGGIAVIAHPGKLHGIGAKDSDAYRSNLDALLRQLKKDGLKGMECYHPSHSESEIYHFVELAGKLHLHITEGSDFHGDI